MPILQLLCRTLPGKCRCSQRQAVQSSQMSYKLQQRPSSTSSGLNLWGCMVHPRGIEARKHHVAAPLAKTSRQKQKHAIELLIQLSCKGKQITIAILLKNLPHLHTLAPLLRHRNQGPSKTIIVFLCLCMPLHHHPAPCLPYSRTSQGKWTTSGLSWHSATAVYIHL